MNRKIFSLITVLIFSFYFLSAQESPETLAVSEAASAIPAASATPATSETAATPAPEAIPLINSEGRIVQISQNSSVKLLAVTFTDRVEVYNTTNFSKDFVIYQDKVQKTAFYTENGNEYIALMTDTGSFIARRIFFDGETWACDFDSPYFAAECSNSSNAQSVTAVAFSRNSDYIAAAFSDGSIQVHFRLRVTQRLISRLIKEHSTGVYGLEFNSTGEYLASVSMDGNASIWNCYSNTKVTQLKDIYARARVPVCFTEDSVYIVSLDGRNSFRISDFSGNSLFSILTGRPITAIKPLKNPDLIAVRNDKNEVMVYSISQRRPVSVSSVKEDERFSVFEFNFAADLMYAALADGKVCAVEALPYLDENSLLVTDSSLAGSGSGKGNMWTNRFQGISIDLGTNYLTKPYLLSGNLRAEYIYCDKTAPWFFGGGLLLQMGFPRKDFPYSYALNGQTVNAPYLCSAALYVPTGLIFSPWNNSISFSATIRLGGKINSLVLLSGGYMVGKPAYSFFVSGGVGMIIKMFEFDINCEYDTIGKVSPSAYAGVILKLGGKK